MTQFSFTAQNPITVSLSNETNSSSVSTVNLISGTSAPSISAALGRGLDGKGWTGVSFDIETGRFTFASNDGLEYVTEDLDLFQVVNTATTEGELPVYNQASHTWVTRKISTDDISDIDNTNKEDGAVLVYNDISSKYQATTFVLGGTF